MKQIPNWVKKIKKNKQTSGYKTGDLYAAFIGNDLIITRVIQNLGEYPEVKKRLQEKEGWTEADFIKLKGENCE